MTYEEQYLEYLDKILTEGKWVYNERTGEKCLTMVNYDFIYTPDESPLLTTKQSFPVSAVAEMLGYLRGYDNAQQFSDIGANTWLSNSNENKIWLANPNRSGENDMGRAYRFRSKGFCNEVKPAIFEKPIDQTLPRVSDTLEVIKKDNDPHVGTVYSSSVSGDYKVISYEGVSEDRRIHSYKIQFLNTGYVTTIQRSQIKTTNIRDPYAQIIHGVGCMGVTEDPHKDLLYKTWVHMLDRCYDPKNDYYHAYGGRGVFVETDWLCFENFVKDFKSMHNWELKKVFPTEYSIDKDWCASNKYSLGTCRWSSKVEQARNTRSISVYKCTDGDEEALVKGIFGVRDYYNLTDSGAFKMSRDLPVVDNHLSYTEVDSLKTVYAKLVSGVDDRGLIMSAWDPHLVEYSCLRPCMYSHQFSVLNGELFLSSSQRSLDAGLGGNFNSIQCYFLLILMARITGLKAGKCYHRIVNNHIYESHIDGVKEMLSRKPLEPNGKIILKDWVKSFDDVVGKENHLKHAREYITVEDYDHQGKIAFKMSV